MKNFLLRSALTLVCVSASLLVPVAHAQAGDVASMSQAASAGQADAVSAFLARGANPDARDARGRTALMLAASAGHYETVRRLLAGGATKNLKDADGKTALDFATEHQHVDLIALMREAS